jgi:hypothetical protein
MLDNSSAQWKIGRAKELLDGLDTEVLAWQDTKPYSFFPYISPNFRRACIFVEAYNDPPIIRWSLIVADIIHNLRCALDHTFWALLKKEFPAGVPPRAERLGLPIWDAPPTADQRRSLQAAGSKLVAAVESVQPYNHPTTKSPVHPLAFIRDIDNGNKHKLLFTVMPSLARINIKVSNVRQAHTSHREEMYRGELKDGVEAVVTTFDVPEPYMKYECTECVAIIAIKHPVANRLGQDRDDYAALIDNLMVEVKRVISDLILKAT